jgi:threonylcarbamoyladenosine tRNA methylthiotransferase MtaB
LTMKVYFSTFGCKTNQYDTALLIQALEEYGFEVIEKPEPADWVVVNTCAVTKRSEDKACQWVRRIGREQPGVSIAVTGCSVEVSSERFSGLPGVRLLLGTEEKFSLGRLLAEIDRDGVKETLSAGPEISGLVRKTDKYTEYPVLKTHRRRSRAFVKIQDGCDNRCTYCIVPFTRGPSRSRPVERVLEEVKSIEGAGHLEAVLTGIHIGRYGMDLPGSIRLADLIESLLDGTRKVRIRLSSVEITELEPALVGLIEREERLCRHLHVPLQHGAHSVLKRMGRHYSPEDYFKTIGSVITKLPGTGLGTDIVLGFPGETEREFEDCVNFVDSLPFSYLHVFPFSPRPGTPAAEMGDVPPKALVRERVKVLRDVSARKKKAFLDSLAGQTVSVLAEKSLSAEISSCRAGNYARVYHEGRPPKGSVYDVLVEKSWRDGVWGSLLKHKPTKNV